MLSRRRFLSLCCAGPLAAAWTRAEAVDTDCLQPLPAEFARHPLVQRAFDGIDTAQLWDVHAHLVGTGDSGSGAYVDPRTESWLHPVERIRRKVMMAAACVDDAGGDVDRRFLQRLDVLMAAFPPGFRMLLFAFDYTVDEEGRERPEQSTFHTPNAYAAAVATARPERFGWVASVHPYRPDALQRLDEAVSRGALAVKWLPSAMNIDPASPRCDAFYARLVQHDVPLVIHCGEEVAAPGARQHAYNNPLRVRRTLAAGVRVIIAHAASLGQARDTDALRDPGAAEDDAPRLASFDLFVRLMEEPRWQGRLFADLSAVFQRNRTLAVQQRLIERRDWHPRLLHGSDYPLPGIGLVYRLQPFVDAGWLTETDADVLNRLRPHNPLLFEFVLKRSLKVGGIGLSPAAFETRRVLDPAARRPRV